MSYVVLDTNIYLKSPNIANNLVQKGYKIIIPITVIDEFDKLKGRDDDIGFKAREALREIDKLNSSTSSLIITGDYEKDPILDLKNQDRKILAVTLLYKRKGYDITLVSEDRGMRLAAQSLKIQTADNLSFFHDVNFDTYNEEKTTNKRNLDVYFSHYGQDLVNRVHEILGTGFIPKYNKSGVTFYGWRGTRILKLVNKKTELEVEFNVPVNHVEDLVILSDREAREKKMGTCRWIYKGDSLSMVLKLVEEAKKEYLRSLYENI